MPLPPITIEFAMICVAVGVGMGVGAYLAARRNEVHREYALVSVVREFDAEGEMENTGQLTFDEAMTQRDAVLDDMADRNSGWLARAAAEMARLAPGTTGIGEDFRRLLRERGIPDPKHPNVYGAFIATMARRGVLVPTGEYRPMREAASNGRKSPVYTLHRQEAA